nr:MAG TPA: hypothetical protein [Caudoviricetes sp.]
MITLFYLFLKFFYCKMVYKNEKTIFFEHITQKIIKFLVCFCALFYTYIYNYMYIINYLYIS